MSESCCSVFERCLDSILVGCILVVCDDSEIGLGDPDLSSGGVVDTCDYHYIGTFLMDCICNRSVTCCRDIDFTRKECVDGLLSASTNGYTADFHTSILEESLALSDHLGLVAVLLQIRYLELAFLSVVLHSEYRYRNSGYCNDCYHSNDQNLLCIHFFTYRTDICIAEDCPLSPSSVWNSPGA